MYFLCLFNSMVVVNLPLDVIGEILSHVPVKSLLCFRATCKSWRSLIDSPYFISLQLNRSIQSNSNTNVIFLSSSGVHEVDFNVVDKAYEVNWSRTCDIYQLLGSQNGLICTRDPRGDMLWNPYIRKVKVPPRLSLKPYNPCDTNVFVAGASGFGYDSSADDYKLLRISQFFDSDNNSFSSQTMCYSSRIDAWKSLENMPYALQCYCYNVVGVFPGGALHWEVTQKHGLDQRYLIVAFDLSFDSFREVALPETGNVSGKFDIHFAVLGGCLCMIDTRGSTRCDFWVMKEYGSKDLWCKLFSLPESVKPLAYSRDGDNVLLLQREKKLCWYNLKSKEVSEVKVSGLPDCLIEGVTCVGTLVPPTLLCDEIDSKQQKLGPVAQFCSFNARLFVTLFCLIILLFCRMDSCIRYSNC